MIQKIVDPSQTRIEKWAAIEGKWVFTTDTARYLGPTECRSGRPVGLARASDRFRDGQISLNLKLSRNEKTTAGIFVRFQSPDAPYCVAQIGVFERAYSISEFHPGAGWIDRASAGALSNLNVSEQHEMKVSVSGQSIKLEVDDVEVLGTRFRPLWKGLALVYMHMMTLMSIFRTSRSWATNPGSSS